MKRKVNQFLDEQSVFNISFHFPIVIPFSQQQINQVFLFLLQKKLSLKCHDFYKIIKAYYLWIQTIYQEKYIRNFNRSRSIWSMI
jgi:hypothetical protein